MIDCKETIQLLSERRDRGLSMRKRIALWRHLLKCVVCRVYEKQLATVCNVCHHAGTEPPPHSPSLPADRKHAILDALERE